VRLITFTPRTAPTSAPRAGALMPGEKTVLNFAVAVDASADVPLLAWFDLDDEWLTKARQIHDGLAKSAERAETLPRGSVLQRSDVVIGPPVPRPGKIICIGLNYKDHAAEMHKPLPEEPLVFAKLPTTVIGAEDPIRLPQWAGRIDHEAELAVVMGRRAANVKAADAMDYVLGLTCLNDVTARELQTKDVQYTRAKGFDTFSPIGPCIAVGVDPSNLAIEGWVNGDKRQSSNTNQLIFPVPELVEFVSRFCTLEPGDIITTGTPSGVGPLNPGDRVMVKLEGVGTLSNPCVAA
jgi:2-keto-4-pentenoate hydratase/2-oxohepta-3-ene-1,7-dioic acid hydratase in catechol pathway